MPVPILLAAGKSTRMGRSKALCDFDGVTALELALRNCTQARLAAPIVVVGHGREELVPGLSSGPLHLHVVENPRYETGQTSSLQCGLRHLDPKARAFFIYPVDHPLIRVEDLHALVHAFGKHSKQGKKIFIPSYGLKRGHPVLVDASLKEDFLRLPEEAPARGVIQARSALIHYVDVDQPYVLMDMDTPADYDKCLQLYRSRNKRV